MNTKAKIHSVLTGILPLAALVLAGSCSVREPDYSGGNDAGDADAPVVINASESLSGEGTRSGERLQVKERELLFTYPSRPSGEMKSAKCKFDVNGYGYVYPEDADGEPLKWKDIYTEKPGGCDVYLDNLVEYPAQVPDPESEDLRKRYDFFTHVEFGPYYSKSAEVEPNDGLTGKKEKVMVAEAGTAEAENGIDIVWGKIATAEIGKSLHFELTHMMSQLTFRFYTEEDAIRQMLEREVTVTLEGVQRSLTRQAGSSHPRNVGNLVPFSRQRGYIEHTGRAENETVLFADGQLEVVTENTTTYYASRTMVLPPHEYEGKDIHPYLRITMSDGNGNVKEYGGGLPFEIPYPDGILGTYIFRSGYHTVFDVKLSSNIDNSVLFENITVSDWTFLKEDNIELSESGISTWEDLTALAEVFNADPSKANDRLMKYGTWKESSESSGGQWVFKLWNDIIIKVPSDGLELPQFDNGNFEIDFNGKTITYVSTEIDEDNYKDHLVKKEEQQ